MVGLATYRRENIYEDDEDRVQLLDVLRSVVEDFNWVCHANDRRVIKTVCAQNGEGRYDVFGTISPSSITVSWMELKTGTTIWLYTATATSKPFLATS